MRTEPGWFALLLAVLLLTLSSRLGAGDNYRLDRASIDHGGGGAAESEQYRLVVAIGQHDADVVSATPSYRYIGGVYARVPSDVLFRNGFEGD